MLYRCTLSLSSATIDRTRTTAFTQNLKWFKYWHLRNNLWPSRLLTCIIVGETIFLLFLRLAIGIAVPGTKRLLCPIVVWWGCWSLGLLRLLWSLMFLLSASAIYPQLSCSSWKTTNLGSQMKKKTNILACSCRLWLLDNKYPALQLHLDSTTPQGRAFYGGRKLKTVNQNIFPLINFPLPTCAMCPSFFGVFIFFFVPYVFLECFPDLPPRNFIQVQPVQWW